MKMRFWLATTAAIAPLVMGTVAFAQTTTQSAPAAAEPAAAEAGDETVVVVTGSLIGRAEAQSQTPLQVISVEEIIARGSTNFADALEKVPALQFTNTVEQSVRDGAVAGRVELNLRGLGTARTLTLVNGRRHVAGAPGTASVDVSTIPSGLVSRVEVLTGGASAIYGSDAVTGVVNFILKDDYEGQEIEAQFSLSGEGDGPQAYMSYLGGRNFADGRGNLTFAASYEAREGIRFGDRPWTRDGALPVVLANPALRFQNGDPLPPGVTPQQAVGQTILIGGNPRFPGTAQSLIDRAGNASALSMTPSYNFAISAWGGLFGFDPTSFFAPRPDSVFRANLDIDGNGVRDCLQSFIGRGTVEFVGGCWVIDRTTGQIRPFRDGLIADTTNQYGGDGAAQNTNGDSLTPDTQNLSLNLNFRYDLTDSATFFGELKGVYAKSREYQFYNTYDDTILIQLDNPFIPAQLRALANQEIAARRALNPAYNANLFRITVARDHTDVLRPEVDAMRQTYRGVFGLRGEFFDSWNYEVSLNYGRTEQEINRWVRQRDRWFAAMDVTTDARGNPICRIALNGTLPLATFLDDSNFGAVAPVSYRPSECRPWNLFGVGNASPEALDFLNYQETEKATIQQTVLRAIVSGDSEKLFSLPGGPIAFALGAEYRKEESDFQPDPLRLGNDNNFWEQRSVAAVSGEFDVSEAFVEVRVPLLSELPFAEELTVNAAYRIGEYSTVGETDAWKADFVWAPVPDIRVRGGVSKTVRAPNISELFLGEQSISSNPRDVCLSNLINLGPNPANRRRNCEATFQRNLTTSPWNRNRTSNFPGIRSGNRDLQEETAESETYGIVLRPRFIPGLTATVDYWSIRIEDAIALVSENDIVAACYDAATLNNDFCALFGRDFSGTEATNPQWGLINRIRRTDVNFAAREAAGVDFDIRYRVPMDALNLDRFGNVTLSIAGTVLEKWNDFTFPSEPNRSNPALGEIDRPEVAGTIGIDWSRGKFGIGWFSSYQSEQALRGVDIERLDEVTPNMAPAIWYHDLSARYELTDTSTVRFGISNITEELPYYGETTGPVSALGRVFFLRYSAQY